jgi:hypothetical protein
MAIDLGGMEMPGAAGAEEQELDLGMDEAAPSPLADVSDEDLLAEAERRKLIEPKMLEGVEDEEEEPVEGMDDLGL